MEGDNKNLRFECAFSKKAMKNNALTIIVFTIIIMAILSYVSWNSVNFKLSLWFTCIYIFVILITSIIGMFSVRRLAKGSYLEISSDGQLKCKFKGKKEVSYPINEIKTIEPATIKDVEKKYATFPIVLNIRGDELYPTEGVLITFNRSWIKSVFPVYFNPKDIEGFIYAIKSRMIPLNLI
ncbi:MAG: hypothetical protein K2N48_12925 [Muribaculaceae bacterium]|nr:hypothetical protein [Muribaculaceae bacterium]